MEVGRASVVPGGPQTGDLGPEELHFGRTDDCRARRVVLADLPVLGVGTVGAVGSKEPVAVGVVGLLVLVR